MDLQRLLDLLTRSFARDAARLKKAEAGHATCKQLIAKAEYELADLKRRFEEIRLAR